MFKRTVPSLGHRLRDIFSVRHIALQAQTFVTNGEDVSGPVAE